MGGWSENRQLGKTEDSPSGSVDTVEYGDHKRRVVDFQPAIQADDLHHGCCGQQYESEDRRGLSELVSRVLSRNATRYELHTTDASVRAQCLEVK